MAPIDYSKWDNIGTHSDPEEVLPQSIPRPVHASSVSSRSTITSVSTEPQSAAAEPIQAVVVRCEVEKRRLPAWSATTIPAHHPVFSQRVLPVPGLLDIPLVLRRVGTRSAESADLVNPIATYLNMDAEIGFAPPAWQSSVGTVLVARKDRKPFLPQHLEGVWMYCDYILDLFGEGGGAPRWLYNRPAFEKWWEGYCMEQRRLRSGDGGEADPDDWRAVRSPYESEGS